MRIIEQHYKDAGSIKGKREHNIRCLSCDRVLLTADLTAGTIKLQCPKCGTPIVVTAKNSRLAVCEDGWDDLAKAE